jgi:hypothetical protein
MPRFNEKANNRVRDIDVAAKGLLNATSDYRTSFNKTSAKKRIQERIGRLVILAQQLADLDEG